jgi:ribonuclease P protein component
MNHEQEFTGGMKPGNEKAGRGLSRFQRILDPAVFRDAFNQDRCFRGKYLVMWLYAGQDSALRLGVVASKRSLRRSVDRSRAKRLLREAYRLNRCRFSGKWDVVLLARRHIVKKCLRDVENDLINVAEAAGLISR